jgi:hypothetical protein
MSDRQDYFEQLRACFADLPAAARADLLDDLAEHLAEVAAEGDGPLADRLGPPDRYAAELRAAAGLAPPGAAATTMIGRWKRRLAVLDRRSGPVLGYERSSDFVRQLAPAWWVLRGYAVAAVLLWAVDGPSLVPRIGGNAWAGGLITAAAIVGSVWLGRLGPARARPVRALAGAAQLVFLGLLVAVTVQAVDVFDRYDDTPSYPVEAGTTPDQPRPMFLMCRDLATDTTRLLLGAGTDNVCPDGYLAIWVVTDDLSRAVEQAASPSPAPS